MYLSGPGAHTFNPVFGHTLNPWNSIVSAGGGSGVALATGMYPWQRATTWAAACESRPVLMVLWAYVLDLVACLGGHAFPLSIRSGSKGRCVADVALMLDGAVGHDPADPLSFQHTGEGFVDALQHTDMPRRVGFSPDLGVVPMEPEVAQVCEATAERFSEIGAQVDRNAPDFSGSIEAFQTLRGVLIAQMMESILQQHRERIAPEIIWNIEKGLAITNAQLLDAERVRSGLYRRITAFFEEYDLLLCPTVSVPPFSKEQRYVQTIDGQPTQTYIDWIAITFAITMTSCPALSLPVGFTKTGLPVGLQVIGPPRSEAALLRACHRMEEVLDLAAQVPIDPR